jgi:MFS family permease
MAQNIQSRSHQRWLIVLVAFYGCCLHAGCLIYAFSLFIKPLQTQFGWERGTIAIAFTLQFLCLGLISPFIGKAVDKYGTRRVITLGSTVVALAFLMLPFIKSTLQFYVVNIIIGLSAAALGPVPCSSAVSAVFTEKRGLAIGLMSTGIGVGGFIFSPLLGGFLIPKFGWQAGYIGIAAAHLLMVPMALTFLRKQPTPISQENQKATGHTSNPGQRGELFSTPFILTSTAFFLLLFSLVGTLQSQVPHLQDIGFPVLTASAALGALGLVSAGAKFFFGWVCDKILPKTAFIIAALFLTAGISLLSIIKPSSPTALLWCYAIIFGIGIGSWLPIMSMMVSSTFGMASYGLIFGGVCLVESIGQAIGPLAAGFLYDITGSYHSAFLLFIAAAIFSIPAVIGIRKFSGTGQPAFRMGKPSETDSFQKAA